ncbi:MAG: alpha/beta hydrolase [Sporichthyaceae bacterium]|nr:alpha/beta hydrolase [Sporichthyaceae bacterium]
MSAPVRPPWPGRLVDLPSGNVHVRAAPPTGDAAEPAVMVHGLGGSASNWTDVMGLLQDRLDTLAPDLPGFGWSPPPVDRDYSVRAHARVVADLIEANTGRPVHLFGNSLGGTVALVVAASRPELVRTLTLVSPALPVLRPRATNIHLPALAVPFAGQRLARRLGRYPVEQRVRATLALCYADPARVPAQRVEEARTEAERRAQLEHESEAMLLSLRSLMSAYVRPRAWPLWRLVAHVHTPTLLVYGLRDRLVDPRTATRAARTFPDAALMTIPDSGHVSQMEHPEVVAHAARGFLAAVDRRTGRRSVR